jgi:hypothetical protein
MLESSFGVLNGTIPLVDAMDVRNVWSFLAFERARDTSVQCGAVAINESVVADQCGVNANVLAVFLRATLVDSLREQGLLDSWRDENGLRDIVFEVASRFPISHLLDFDSSAFITALGN